MAIIPTDFHFLRPLWLLTVVPAILLFLAIRHSRAHAGRWDQAIDSALLPYLLDGTAGKQQRWPVFVLLFAWLLAGVSLAGPVWEKLPQPVQKKTDALILIQDLSLSFFAQDLSPNRLTRARHKLLDILRQRQEGTTALIVYAGDAHVVAPLTDDTNTIAAMVPELSPAIMPSLGSNLPDAVGLALRLFRDGGGGGRILLITDEVAPESVGAVVKLLAGENIPLSILGVGTEDGAPIPKNDGGFLKDAGDNIIVPKLNRAALRDLAAKTDGRYSDLQLADSDINYLLAAPSRASENDQYRRVDREFDQWREEGHWLVLLILPLAVLGFRRGWLIGLVMVLTLSSNVAHAMSWQDLWLRKDQQAAKALADNDPQQAARLFKSPQWQGVAEYRAGNYEGAAAVLGGLDSPEAHYNLGNALAKKGRLEEALKAYDQALRRNPEPADAKFNKELVEKLLRQQKEQQQPQGEKQKTESGDSAQGQDQQGKEQGQQSQAGNQSDKGPGAQGQDQQGNEQGDQSQAVDRPDKEQGGKENNGARTGEQKKDDAAKDAEQGQAAAQKEAAEAGTEPATGSPGEEGAGKQAASPQSAAPEDKLTAEQQQALEQWLRKIPDNPGGLLKRKFEYQYRQNQNRDSQSSKKIW